MKGSVFQPKGSDRWKWVWTERLKNGPPDTHQHSGWADTKRQAEADLRASLQNHDKGHRTNPKTQTTVSQLLELWYLSQQATAEPASLVSYRSHINGINPHLGKLGCRKDLTTETILEMMGEWRKPGANRKDSTKGLAESTIKVRIKTLRAACKWGVLRGYMPTNPCGGDNIPLSKDEGIPGDIWNAVELEQFMTMTQAVGDPFLDLWELLAGTGMRRGEALGLKTRNIDLEAKTILISERHACINGRMVHRKGTKGGRYKIRTIDIDDSLVATIQRRVEAQKLDRAVAGRDWINTGLLFTNSDGEGVHAHQVDRAWQKAVEVSGNLYARVHDLRHTHATLLLMGGMDPRTVCDRLGHSDPGYTLRVYGHVLKGRGAEAARLWQTIRAAAQGLMGIAQEGTRRTVPGTVPDELYRTDGH